MGHMDQPQSPDLTVLIVEPVETTQRLLEVVLREVASRRFVAAGPDEARTILERESADIVVLEPQVPTGLSWDFLDEMVARDIPTVVLTSRADDWVLADAAQHGATAVVTKPFPPADLKTII